MKKIFKSLLKILKWIFIVLVALLVILLIVRFVGKTINNRTPDGGINETMYVDINGTKQWINIYGQDKGNPVLLYLHGGPCVPTSGYDWSILRKLSADYTVVNWDQRGCGHNYPAYKETEPITAEQMLSDGIAMTDFLCEYLQKDKITLYGNSWGSIFAANLALDNPGRYDALIVSSLVVDPQESRTYFKEYMLEQSKDDPEIYSAAQQFDPALGLSEQNELTLQLCYSKYSYTDDIFADSDFNWVSSVFFNPYCTLTELYYLLGSQPEYYNMLLDEHPYGDALCAQIPIGDRTEYEMPFYLIEGDKDYGPTTMVELAADYYEEVDAPDKELFYINGGHGSPLLKCDQLAEIVHKIAEKQIEMQR